MTEEDPRHGTVTGYNRIPCREECCRSAYLAYRKLRDWEAARGRPRKVSALGVRRRIQALMAVGWSRIEISLAAGYPEASQGARIVQLLQVETVTRPVAERIAAAYASLLTRPSPTGYGAIRSRNEARRNSWAPPNAWLDIDDPNDVPDFGDDGRMSPAEKLAEFEWLTSLGVSESEALRQVGWSQEAMEKHLQRTKKDEAA